MDKFIQLSLSIFVSSLLMFGCSSGSDGNNAELPQPRQSTWGVAELIETSDSGNSYQPQIAIDSNGNAIAVWGQNDGTLWNFWANRFDGHSWGTPELIETNDSGDASNPQIAIDSNGNAIAVWGQDDGTLWNIWANRFDGQSWGTPELIETNDSGDVDKPQIAMDTSGKAIAVWEPMPFP